MILSNHFKSLCILFIFLLHIVAIQSHGGCGTQSPATHKQQLDKLAIDELTASNPDHLSTRQSQMMSFPINWHIVSNSGQYGYGNLTIGQIKKSINILNNWFKNSSFSFYLQTVSYTVNDSWWDVVVFSEIEGEMKRSLHVGNMRHLNIISTQINYWGGYSSFPVDQEGKEDRILISVYEIPYEFGDSRPGTLLVHEVGHWLGVYHTFQGGCTAPGDYVDDTPYQGQDANYVCDGTADTCPNQPGLDDTTNIMDYGGDSCRDHFTLGQTQRMRSEVMLYRNMEPMDIQSPIPINPEPQPVTTSAITTSAPSSSNSSTTASASVTTASASVTTASTQVTTSATQITTSAITSSSVTTSVYEITTSVQPITTATTPITTSVQQITTSLITTAAPATEITTSVNDITTQIIESSTTSTIPTITTKSSSQIPTFMECDVSNDQCPPLSTCVNNVCKCDADGSFLLQGTTCPEPEIPSFGVKMNVNIFISISILIFYLFI